MQISNRFTPSRLTTRSNRVDANPAGPTDSVTLGGRSGDSLAGVACGGLGAIPVAGACLHLTFGVDASVEGQKNLTRATILGGVSNLAGTALTAGGLLTGNSTATRIGLGMLGASAAAGVYVGYNA